MTAICTNCVPHAGTLPADHDTVTSVFVHLLHVSGVYGLLKELAEGMGPGPVTWGGYRHHETGVGE